MSKRAFPPLQSDRVRLRLLEPADLPLTLAWRNRDEIRRWFFTSDVLTPEGHRAWFDGYVARDDDFVFVIEERAEVNRPVGQVALYHVDWQTGRAEFGRLMIGEPDAAHRGLAREATTLLVNHALTDLGLREVYLMLRADNASALAVYRACGFETTSQDGDTLTMTKCNKESAPCAESAAS